MAKNKGGVGTLPHEIMMEAWRKEGRVRREELSLKSITLDHQLQARDKPLDLDNVRALHAIVKDGLSLAPIVVFRVDGKDFVGNGFHRCEVHRKEGLPSIKADVVNATWQEAVEYATCCNMANHALTPNVADKKKACFMLLDNGWENKAAREIASRVGLSSSSVTKYRAAWCQENGKSLPDTFVTRNGTSRRNIRTRGGLPSICANSNGSGFKARLGGKTVHLPARTKEEAAIVLQKKIGDRFADLHQSAGLDCYRKISNVAGFLAHRGIYLDTKSVEVHGLSVGVCRGVAVACIPDDLRSIRGPSTAVNAIVQAVGRVLLVPTSCDATRKVVLVFESIHGYENLVSLARRAGVEFMTLDEFVEAVKAEESASVV